MRKITVKISEGIPFHSNEVYSLVSHLKFREVKLVFCKIIVFTAFTEISNISTDQLSKLSVIQKEAYEFWIKIPEFSVTQAALSKPDKAG